VTAPRAASLVALVLLAVVAPAGRALAEPALPALPMPPSPSPLAQPNALPGSPAPSSSPDTASATKPPPAAPAAHTTRDDSLFAIKVIGGLIVLLVLAYLGAHRRVARFQQALGIEGVITAGFPFIALGLVAAHEPVNILTGDVLSKLQPVLHFGLGWLGFLIGAQLDIRVLDKVPKGTAYLIVVEALGPFALTAAGCGAVMLAFGQSWDDRAVWRDLIVLATAAAMTAPRRFHGFANRTWHEGGSVDALLGQLDELVSIVGLLFVTAYFREATSTAWQLPDTAWIFISLGLGLAVGALIFAMLRVPATDPEFLAIVLGGIAFASGLAGYLHLSPIVVCFLAGTLITNFPNDQRDAVFRILSHLERPVHLLFLIIVGALWDVNDWHGWVLVPLFVIGRALGRWTGVIASKTAVGALLPSGFAEQRALITPMSGLSIALVISIDHLHDEEALRWIVTAVVGGSLVTEILLQRRRTANASQPIAVQSLAEALAESGPDGPVYRDSGPSRRGGEP
jgi:Kef-type K+ transport system membrane component KefB